MSRVLRCIIGDYREDGSFPIDWTLVDQDLFDYLRGDQIFNVGSINEEGCLVESTVLYLLPVKKFSGDITKEFVNDASGSLIIGISE